MGITLDFDVSKFCCYPNHYILAIGLLEFPVFSQSQNGMKIKFAYDYVYLYDNTCRSISKFRIYQNINTCTALNISFWEISELD